MSITFWAAMVSMLFVAIGILIFPLLRVRESASIAYRESNLQLHKSKIQELDVDLAEGRIDQAHYRVARQELDRELLDDVPVESKDTAALHYSVADKRHPGVALTIAVFLPALALLLYMQLGMHSVGEQAVAGQAMPSVAEMVRTLEQRLNSGGGKAEEWAMLARAYKHLQRYNDAIKAFDFALERAPSAQLMLEQAETLALSNNQRFDGRARALIQAAREREPDNINVLWFAGVAEFQAGNYHQSIEHLARLAPQAAQDPEINKSVRFYIEKAREQLIAAGDDMAPVDEILGLAATGSTASDSGARLQVQVTISEVVKQKFSDSDVVFVYAKAAQGPKMPLAVQRLSLAQLPASVTLDDNMAMVEGMNLSAFSNVIVSARVTKSGSAIARSGDYIGQMKIDDISAPPEINIVINQIVP